MSEHTPLTEAEVSTLRHVALILHSDGSDGRDAAMSQARLIAAVERIVTARTFTATADELRCCYEFDGKICAGTMDRRGQVYACRSCQAQCWSAVHPGHTFTAEAERKVTEAIAKWEDRGPTSLTVALLAEAVYAARDALAARTSTATADTGLRERVEALADQWERLSRDYSLANCRPHRLSTHRAAGQLRAMVDATPASTEDRADNEGTR